MSKKIESEIVGYEVVKNEDDPEGEQESEEPELEHVHENIQRPESLEGKTYKIKTPLNEHALYVTINDIVLNQGTKHESRRPLEVFINSKDMEQFQWIVALTRIISAVFRKGGDCEFLAGELRSVFDPRGGYFKRGGRYMPSLVAEIGDVIETHMRETGAIQPEGLDDAQRQYLAQKRAEIEGEAPGGNDGRSPEEASEGGQEEAQDDFPPEATVCPRCHTRALVVMDGCKTCLNCLDSKCG